MVLDHCTSDYELINIRIFETDGEKVFGEIEVLAKALELCLELCVDIVSLSAVSSILSDSKHLYDVTLSLAKKAVIISSLDNADYITVPTSYPHVVGVRSDTAKMLSPGELAFCADDPFNANIYANCNFTFLRGIGHGPSNSFAAPVVAAYVDRLINSGHSKDRIISMINELEPYPIIKRFGNRCKPTFTSREIPVILLSGYTNETCLAIMDCLYINHEVQSAALSMVKGGYDVRVRESSGYDNIENDLNFVKSCYKTDIIFIVSNNKL